MGKSQDAERIRRKRLYSANQTKGISRFVEGFNWLYPRFLEFLIGVGDILMTSTQTVMISLGVPILLILLLIVEQQRVVHGILLFEIDPNLAALASWALVMLNLVLEFMIHYIEHQAHYQTDTGSRFSLRVWLQNALYVLGLDRNWQSRPASPAQWYKSLLRLVTFTILALALTGSMQSVIVEAKGAWYIGIIRILSDSSLLLIMTWVGALLFAAVAVLGAQSMSRAVAVRTVERSLHV